MKSFLVLALMVVITGPAKDPTSFVTFEFIETEHKESFVARTSDAAVIALVREELSKPLEERSLHINGAIGTGGDGNAPWKWHYLDHQWTMSQLSMELCDSWPSYVDANLEAWMDEVGSLCPWASRVTAER